MDKTNKYHDYYKTLIFYLFIGKGEPDHACFSYSLDVYTCWNFTVYSLFIWSVYPLQIGFCLL